jgi:nicotinamidase-related amidase
MDGSRYFTESRSYIPPIRLVRDETALIIIDMQYSDASADQGLNVALERIDPGCMEYFNTRNETRTIPSIQRLLAYFRAEGLKVIYVTLGSHYRDLRDMPERTRGFIRNVEARSGVQDLFWAGNPAYAIRREIAPLPDETVINKTTWGAFNSTPIDLILQSMNVRTLVITGVTTNHCVETTARDAADKGYATIIVDEATCDYDQAAQDAMLHGFAYNFGRVVKTAEDAIDALRDEAEV